MIPEHLLNSKLITDREWEEYQKLKEEKYIFEKGKARYGESIYPSWDTERIEMLEKENEKLKNIYMKVAIKQKELGHEELAEYMLAQIDAIPTFVPQDIDIGGNNVR